MTLTVTDHKQATNKTWARIAAELTEHAMSRDPDKMNRIFEGRVYNLVSGAKPKPWESLALADYIGEGASFC